MLRALVARRAAAAAVALLAPRAARRTLQNLASRRLSPDGVNVFSPVSKSAGDAVKIVESGNTVFVHSVASAPQQLIRELVARAPELSSLSFVHIHTEGAAPYVAPEFVGKFRTKTMFCASNTRNAVNTQPNVSYAPVFLSEIPTLFQRGIIPVDVAMISVSPPDRHGFCSLGPSVDVSIAAIFAANHVIAQVNPKVPRVHGDGFIHVSNLDSIVWCDEPLHEHPRAELSDAERAIGRHIAAIVEDGATLQMGIGAIPDAVLSCLTSHKDLGIHSEMFSDGVLPLLESGVVNNRLKKRRAGKVVGGFVMGTQRLYDFIDDNPSIELRDIRWVNDMRVISSNPKVTAINSAIEIDLTGQVCADSIGTRMYSGVGGQIDFIRAAALSEGGKPIIALPSTTGKGESKIVPTLKNGAGVVSTRAHVHHVATEFGIVNLFGKSLKERAHALISIAHPAHREALERAAFERFH